MTPEEEAAWKSRRRAIARACYRRNAPEVIARVAAYKSKKKAKKAEKAKVDKRPCCVKCGARVDSKNDYANNHKQCQPCRDEQMEEWRKERADAFFAMHGFTEEKARRKWFKFVCKEDRYDPIVFIDSEFDFWKYLQIQATEVVNFLDRREIETKSGKYKIKGYYRWDAKSHGFFSDNGKAGIHDMGSHNSNLVKMFWEQMREAAWKRKCILREIERKRAEEKPIMDRIKALHRKVRDIRRDLQKINRARAAINNQPKKKAVPPIYRPLHIKGWKSASSFFQIANMASVISEHSKTA